MSQDGWVFPVTCQKKMKLLQSKNRIDRNAKRIQTKYAEFGENSGEQPL
jgi:hypothetical protein